KDVSKNYKFPKTKTIASRIGLDYETTKKMKKLIKKGYNNKEICEKLGIEKTKKITNSMNGVRWNLEKKLGKKLRKMSKVQRPSKAQETPKELEIEEEVIFGWELEVSRVAPQAYGGPV
ncbi:MAG: hypothetical protein NC548_45645, partial [Lachnospiraceae bacterium]|nr:hypothetical protein [Lachnospiraceae bacterium]